MSASVKGSASKDPEQKKKLVLTGTLHRCGQYVPMMRLSLEDNCAHRGVRRGEEEDKGKGGRGKEKGGEERSGEPLKKRRQKEEKARRGEEEKLREGEEKKKRRKEEETTSGGRKRSNGATGWSKTAIERKKNEGRKKESQKETKSKKEGRKEGRRGGTLLQVAPQGRSVRDFH